MIRLFSLTINCFLNDRLIRLIYIKCLCLCHIKANCILMFMIHASTLWTIVTHFTMIKKYMHAGERQSIFKCLCYCHIKAKYDIVHDTRLKPVDICHTYYDDQEIRACRQASLTCTLYTTCLSSQHTVDKLSGSHNVTTVRVALANYCHLAPCPICWHANVHIFFHLLLHLPTS